ncbi:MAG: hypothetical protein QGG50_02460, partial [Methanopyri archaeon]|nr:hypothetical protein [Methanopyri archaeon]
MADNATLAATAIPSLTPSLDPQDLDLLASMSEPIGETFLEVISNPVAVVAAGLSVIIMGQVLKNTQFFNTKGWEAEIAVVLILISLTVGAESVQELPLMVRHAILVVLWIGYLFKYVTAGAKRNEVREMAAGTFLGGALALAGIVLFVQQSISGAFIVPLFLIGGSLGGWIGSSVAKTVYTTIHNVLGTSKEGQRGTYTARIGGYANIPRPDGHQRRDYRLWITRYDPRELLGGKKESEGTRYTPGIVQSGSDAKDDGKGKYGNRITGYIRKLRGIPEEEVPDGVEEPAEKELSSEGTTIPDSILDDEPRLPKEDAAPSAKITVAPPTRLPYGTARVTYDQTVIRFLERAKNVFEPAVFERLEGALNTIPTLDARAVVSTMVKTSAAMKSYNGTGPEEPLKIGPFLTRFILPILTDDGS